MNTTIDKLLVQDKVEVDSLTYRNVLGLYSVGYLIPEMFRNRSKTFQGIDEKLKHKINDNTLNGDLHQHLRREIMNSAAFQCSDVFLPRDTGVLIVNMAAALMIINKRKNLESKNRNEKIKIFGEYIRKINFTRRFHFIMLLLLAKAYDKKNHTFIISKAHLMKMLGTTTNNTRVVNEVKLYLEWLHLIKIGFWDFNLTDTGTEGPWCGQVKISNPLILKIDEENTYYRMTLNPEYIGCVFLNNSKRRRGYVVLPTAILESLHKLKDSEYYLTCFLLEQGGNSSLNTKEEKIVSFNLKDYIDAAKIKIKAGREKDSIIKLLKSFKGLFLKGLIKKVMLERKFEFNEFEKFEKKINESHNPFVQMDYNLRIYLPWNHQMVDETDSEVDK